MNNAALISKCWKGKKGCKKSPDGNHWAFYIFQSEEERFYWTTEHRDDENKFYWRHYEFMSIPCTYCGAYSPLRTMVSFMTGGVDEYKRFSCGASDVINYHPYEYLPKFLRTYEENGWFYIFFVETLSDSLHGQETFTLKSLPT